MTDQTTTPNATPAAQMTNPPTDQTKLVKPTPQQTKTQAPARKTVMMVKVKALRDFLKPGTTDQMVKAGDIVQVTEEQAADLCKPMLGAYSFSGERYSADIKEDPNKGRHNLQRARRAIKADLIPDKSQELPGEEVEQDAS